MTENNLSENPLFNQGELPDFNAIRPEHVVPAVREAIRIGRAELQQLETLNTPTWKSFVEPLRAISRRLDRIWGAVNHLTGVKNSAELRAAHETVQPEIVEFQLLLGQNRKVYEAWQRLTERAATELTTPARTRIAAAALRDAKLAGVGLEGAAKERFNIIQRDLAQLATRFSNAVLDATREFKLLLKTSDEVQGLPQSWLAMAAQAALENGHSGAGAEAGPWLLTLDFPSYYPFLQHAKNRALREQVYRANATRASGSGYSAQWNNWPVIDEILKLRREEAALLGFENYAAVSLTAKMAPDAGKVRSMIHDLARVARPQAMHEMHELHRYAAGRGLEGEIRLWDVAFYSERRREELYSYTDEELRPYFPLPKVLTGMFSLAQRLFGVTIAAAKDVPPLWHKDVQFFDVLDTAGKKIAAFYLDPYARSGEKRGGAWMDVCRQREVVAPFDGAPKKETQSGSQGATGEKLQVVIPVAYLICNGTPPVLSRVEGPVNSTGDGEAQRPSLMTFSEVETLFHEFGHGLQHMLTRVDEYEAAGISNVEWDAVELPSQFMENWVYERSVIDEISGHWQTAEKLPQALFEKIIAAKNYMAGSILLRQLYFSLLDLELHEKFSGESNSPTVREIQAGIAAEYTVIPPLPEDAFLCSFSHIFAGGYAAGYYSYKWAEVLSADAFAAFEEAGLANDTAIRELGRRYRETVLALGGSRHPLEVYREFRGRDATIDALLRHNGLLPAA